MLQYRINTSLRFRKLKNRGYNVDDFIPEKKDAKIIKFLISKK